MVKIYLDGANLDEIRDLEPRIDGITTNPSLMRKAGIKDYREFADLILDMTDKPVSFEVGSDDIYEMITQARKIALWGKNVYVKIPVMTTKGEWTFGAIERLLKEEIKLNITAVFTYHQIEKICKFEPDIISVFAGRIADTGRDPVSYIRYAVEEKRGKTQVLWASTREVLNVKQAEAAGCDIITMTPDLIRKMDLFGKPLAIYSHETVKQFYDDAKGLKI